MNAGAIIPACWWYEDSVALDSCDGSDPTAIDREFRRIFAATARIAARWSVRPDYGAAKCAKRLRRLLKERATLTGRHARAIGRQIAYRKHHAIVAAAARAHHQALQCAVDDWDRLENRWIDPSRIVEFVMPRWLRAVEAWASEPIAALPFMPPPRPCEVMTEAELDALAEMDDEPREERRVIASASAAVASPPSAPITPTFLSVGELVRRYPELRPRVIEGLLREGETMNVIASPKTGKSWLTIDIALAVAMGRPWLGRFETTPGDVLIIDNELHAATSAHRIPLVAEMRGLSLDEYGHRVHLVNLRGKLVDLNSLATLFAPMRSGRYKLVVLDAFYRFVPKGMDENANADVAGLYNTIDRYAAQMRSAFVLIHHSTKGNQSAKSVTDVGAGAGAQSRAADTHLVMRPHEEEGAVVLDAAARSWPPLRPFCLRWQFPVWTLDDSLDASALKRERPLRRGDGRPGRGEAKSAMAAWEPERFAQAFVTDEPKHKDDIRARARAEAGLSWRQVDDLLYAAHTLGFIHRWVTGRAHRVEFATVPQPTLERAE